MTNSITGTNFDLAVYRPLLTTDPNFALYERFKQGSNPYMLYNNQDRFLNAIHRGWTTGGLAALQQSNSNKLPQNIGAIYYFGPPSSEDATFQYEKQTNMMSQYFWASTQSRVNTIGLTLTVPLFEGFARTYKVRGAQAQAEQSYAQFLDAELQVSMDVVKAYADAQSSFENLNSSNTWLQAAQAAVQSAQKRYDKGAADILELLSTQNTLADAQQERVRCVSEWRSSRLRLMASAGMLDRYQIMNTN